MDGSDIHLYAFVYLGIIRVSIHLVHSIKLVFLLNPVQTPLAGSTARYFPIRRTVLDQVKWLIQAGLGNRRKERQRRRLDLLYFESRHNAAGFAHLDLVKDCSEECFELSSPKKRCLWQLPLR